MKIVATRRAEQNRAALDPWTAVHFSAGLAMGLLDIPRGLSLGAALVYEFVEQAVERSRWGTELFETKGPESPENAVLDMAVFLAGHLLGARWLQT